MGRWTWMIAVVAGCGSAVHDESSFEDAFAVRWCERQEECARGDFERDFSSMDDCVDAKEDDLHIPRWDHDCDLDPDGADECLDFLETVDCEDFDGKEIEEGCEHAYDEC
jgi:hypothetical protein